MGCVSVPGFGWKEIRSGEKVENHFFGVRRGPREGAGGKRGFSHSLSRMVS